MDVCPSNKTSGTKSCNRVICIWRSSTTHPIAKFAPQANDQEQVLFFVEIQRLKRSTPLEAHFPHLLFLKIDHPHTKAWVWILTFYKIRSAIFWNSLLPWFLGWGPCLTCAHVRPDKFYPHPLWTFVLQPPDQEQTIGGTAILQTKEVSFGLREGFYLIPFTPHEHCLLFTENRAL